MVSPAPSVAEISSPAIEAVRASGSSCPAAVRSTSTWARTTPVAWSSESETRGRTEEIRAVDQACSRIGRQIPAVTSVGPQSQPKPQAIRRMY